LLVESLPESPRLWTDIVLDIERGLFVPPLVEEHDSGVFMSSGNLYARPELTPSEDLIVKLIKGRALELGAGPARVSRALRDRGVQVVTTDADNEIVEMYSARGWADSCPVSLPEIPAVLGKFDAVIALRGVLGLSGEIDAVRLSLQRIRDSLNPGGRLIFTASRVQSVLVVAGRSPLEYRVRFIYRGRRSAWLRGTALPEWLAIPFLNELGFGNLQTIEPVSSEGIGYVVLAQLNS
jgi:SAM-dependent methyltransferase